MRKILFIFLIAFTNLVFGQNGHVPMLEMSRGIDQDIEPAPEMEKVSSDTTSNVVDGIEDEVTDFFTNQLDSLIYTWKVQNSVALDSSEVTLEKTFPRNIPDSVYIQRLKDIEQVLDLSFNKTVRNYIKMYTEKRRTQMEVMLGQSAYYFPIFEETLDKYNLPLELKYLPVIESALNPKARSRVGATGLWQFMYGTAKQYKLEVTSFTDDRSDPVKASDAAARYLSKLYQEYGDWHLAIAAYNCGPGNVKKAIRRSGGKRNYWEIYYRLPRETRGYVPAFIAAMYAMEYFKEHELNPKYPEIPLLVDTIVVRDYLHFDQLEAELGLEKEMIRALNPMFRRDVIPAKKDKPYALILPEETVLAFIDRDSSIYAHEREKYFPNNTLQEPVQNSGTYYTPVDVKGKAKLYYKVKQGDNVGFIASWYNIRQSDLRYWNNISRNLIRVGQKLVVYVPEARKEKYASIDKMSFAQKQASVGKPAGSTGTKKSASLDPTYEYYTVRKGDTLLGISKKYAGITADEIKKINQIRNERSLYIGQKLKIRKKL